ncbi:hypothetical protein PGH12_07615 [Chryseobacterium wangxinyae]|uniref:hypothetical protein n=1 Tax=Chryseobacterium sp. CY350 TaxID=2997336 RepID=UPI00226E6601|nr:hypothetical protein [Chryseobacterium sp. CY350]MCY0977012.1 hypothetical protein [Chryseobacterium sp. CY350]WBZ97011.1 hypothetical protein PGH12_07615 [Chryseobacterium sp. CY350]
MKNLVFILIFIFPLIITAIIVSGIIKVDSRLELVKENPVSKENLKKKLFIDKHASKRRVYFFLNDSDKSRYERNYRGLITNWKVLENYERFENSSTLNFYREIKVGKTTDKKKSFFSLNNEEKNFSYYFDIFQFVKEKYFFALLIVFLLYVFGAGWLIDYYGGITHLKYVGVIFGIDIIYLLLMLFW